MITILPLRTQKSSCAVKKKCGISTLLVGIRSPHTLKELALKTLPSYGLVIYSGMFRFMIVFAFVVLYNGGKAHG